MGAVNMVVNMVVNTVVSNQNVRAFATSSHKAPNTLSITAEENRDTKWLFVRFKLEGATSPKRLFHCEHGFEHGCEHGCEYGCEHGCEKSKCPGLCDTKWLFASNLKVPRPLKNSFIGSATSLS